MSGEEINSSLNGTDDSFTDSAGRLVMIICDCLLATFQAQIFCFVLKCAWDNYCESMGLHKKTLLHFLRHLPPVKSCFLVSNLVIFTSTTIFIGRLSLPPPRDNFTCTLALRITGPTCYITELVSVYVYLWARQYYLHSSMVLKRVMPKWLPVLSKISLTLAAVAYVIQIVVFWVPIYSEIEVESVYKDGHCYHKDKAVTVLPYIVLFVSILTQGSYVLLFCVIVASLNKANRNARSCKNKSSSMAWIAPRCLTQAIICIISNSTSMILINVLGPLIPEVYVHIAPQTDVTINLICMLLCFNHVNELARKAVSMVPCRPRESPNCSGYLLTVT